MKTRSKRIIENAISTFTAIIKQLESSVNISITEKEASVVKLSLEKDKFLIKQIEINDKIKENERNILQALKIKGKIISCLIEE